VRLPLKFSALLFEVTHLGTPVIIVLDTFAETDMEEAVAALDERQHPSDWTDGAELSGDVRSGHRGRTGRSSLMEDGRKIRRQTIETRQTTARWASTSSSCRARARAGCTGPGSPIIPTRPSALARGTGAEPAAHPVRLLPRDEHEKLHPGLVLVVSDLAATPGPPVGQDFVIMTGREPDLASAAAKSKGMSEKIGTRCARPSPTHMGVAVEIGRRSKPAERTRSVLCRICDAGPRFSGVSGQKGSAPGAAMIPVSQLCWRSK
jgi:hypothetical protein